MTVDSFKFLPRLIAAYYQASQHRPELPIPWTPLPRPLAECKFGLVTSGGLFHQGVEPPFDLEREKAEPTWGDPNYRSLPAGIRQAELGASHLHINTRPVLADINILLPIHRFQELKKDGSIGGLAPEHYAFMGYQGFPPDLSGWQNQSGPAVAAKFKAAEVDCVLLTPA